MAQPSTEPPTVMMRLGGKCLAMAVAATAMLVANAHAFAAPAPEGVSVTGCWIRGMPARLPSAGYLQLRNQSPRDVVVVGAQADGFGSVMLHEHQSAGGMSAMVHVGKVTVPAGGTFAFAPGGHHIMLERPSADVVVGSRRPITLLFEGDRSLTAECEVRPPATLK